MIKLELTDEQAKIVSTACEFYARMKMGQFGEVLSRIMNIRENPEHYSTRRECAERLLFSARAYIYPQLQGPGHSYGIGKFPEADKAFDVHQVIDYALTGIREPWSYYELPKCEREDDGT